MSTKQSHRSFEPRCLPRPPPYTAAIELFWADRSTLYLMPGTLDMLSTCCSDHWTFGHSPCCLVWIQQEIYRVGFTWSGRRAMLFRWASPPDWGWPLTWPRTAAEAPCQPHAVNFRPLYSLPSCPPFHWASSSRGDLHQPICHHSPYETRQLPRDRRYRYVSLYSLV